MGAQGVQRPPMTPSARKPVFSGGGYPPLRRNAPGLSANAGIACHPLGLVGELLRVDNNDTLA
jgi:hypothetical protein